jgi:CubicO group peptidase (beta-lactamase class C family)
LGVEGVNGTRTYQAYGMADLEGGIANTPSTIFEAGSVSKQFTVAAVVLLALDGRLSLDDDIRTHIPEVPDYGEPIRLRHLIHHTSGLRDWGSVAGISGWGRGDRTHSHAHVLEIVSRQNALNFPPGFEYSYSNTGFNLLAMVVERVTGESFAAVSHERIFEPLGLAHTGWRNDYTRIVPGRSGAYAPTPDGGYRIDRPIEHVHGNGGLLTTVGDLLRWDEALRTGAIGGPRFVELMHEVGVLSSGRPIHYAGGLQIGSLAGVPEVAHTGSTAGYRAFLGRYEEQGLAVALLCNSGDVNPGQVGREVARLFLGEAATVANEVATDPGADGVALSREALEARAGLYRNERTDAPLRIRMEDGELRLEGGAPLVPRSDVEFQVGRSQQRIVFQEASPGEPTGFLMMDGGWEGDLHCPTTDSDPSSEELAAYEGTFASGESESELRVAVDGGRLLIHRRPDTRLPLTPIYPDAFSAPSLGRILFRRDPNGEIVELSVQQPRVYDLRFRRVDPE